MDEKGGRLGLCVMEWQARQDQENQQLHLSSQYQHCYCFITYTQSLLGISIYGTTVPSSA